MAFDLKNYWLAFIRWKGWKSCGDFFIRLCRWEGWGKLIRWSGWKRIFLIRRQILLLLILLSAVGLIYVFLSGMSESFLAYLLYPISAYTLIALLAGIPALISRVKGFLAENPKLLTLIKNRKLRFEIGLYFEQLINFAYGIFKIISGIVIGSAWIGADGIYNFTQGVIQLYQILRRRKDPPALVQWKSYRACGVLILLMHLTLTGLVFQMVNLGRSEEYPGYMIFAVAAFTFYKLIDAFIDVARDRRHKAPIDSSVRLLNLAQAFFSIFSLQVAMIHVFGGDMPQAHLMNLLTGCAVCALTVGLGIYMICRAGRELKKLK